MCVVYYIDKRIYVSKNDNNLVVKFIFMYI